MTIKKTFQNLSLFVTKPNKKSFNSSPQNSCVLVDIENKKMIAMKYFNAIIILNIPSNSQSFPIDYDTMKKLINFKKIDKLFFKVYKNDFSSYKAKYDVKVVVNGNEEFFYDVESYNPIPYQELESGQCFTDDFGTIGYTFSKELEQELKKKSRKHFYQGLYFDKMFNLLSREELFRVVDSERTYCINRKHIKNIFKIGKSWEIFKNRSETGNVVFKNNDAFIVTAQMLKES